MAIVPAINKRCSGVRCERCERLDCNSGIIYVHVADDEPRGTEGKAVAAAEASPCQQAT